MSPTPDASSLVPTIDLSAPTAAELTAVDAACRDHGFFLLVGHGAEQLIADMWRNTEAFFAQDEAVKGPVRRTVDNPFGYWDRELTKRKRDHKEVFDYADPSGPTGHLNRWPAGHDEFRTALIEFYDTFSQLATGTLGVIRDALGLGDEHSAEELGFLNERTSSAVRLNHYPVGDPVPADQRGELAELGPTALGYHTDPGVLTLLLQDNTGGLQAESTTHGWIDVPPLTDAIVVNLGDTMQVWTNDQYKAAVHRVVPMTERSRYSIPYFSNPPRHTVLEPLTDTAHSAGRSTSPAEWRTTSPTTASRTSRSRITSSKLERSRASAARVCLSPEGRPRGARRIRPPADAHGQPEPRSNHPSPTRAHRMHRRSATRLNARRAGRTRHRG